VAGYRAYIVGRDGYIVGSSQPLVCDSDKEAIKRAKRLLIDDHCVELCRDGLLITRLNSRGGATTTHEIIDGRLVPKSPKLDLEAEALDALEKARALPHGRERAEALKNAGTLQKAADSLGITFAKRGRPVKT
jgi:hypothetical protein